MLFARQVDYFFNHMVDLPVSTIYECDFMGRGEKSIDPFCADESRSYENDSLVSRDFHLDVDGKLYLRSITTIESDEERTLSMNVRIEGDFHVLVRHTTNSPVTRIPFRQGQVCRDLDEWDISTEPLTARIGAAVPGGFIVFIDDLGAYLPHAFVPEELRDKPELLRNRVIECDMVRTFDKQRPPIVKPRDFDRR